MKDKDKRFLTYSKRMERKYVAQVSFGDGRIVAFGENPSEVLKRARKIGFPKPVIYFNPRPSDVLVGGKYYKRDASGLLRPIN